MYALALHVNGQPTQTRTAETGGEIRTALWDVLTAARFEIKDEHHADLMAQAGAARDKADLEGFAAIVYPGRAALTLHTS